MVEDAPTNIAAAQLLALLPPSPHPPLNYLRLEHLQQQLEILHHLHYKQNSLFPKSFVQNKLLEEVLVVLLFTLIHQSQSISLVVERFSRYNVLMSLMIVADNCERRMEDDRFYTVCCLWILLSGETSFGRLLKAGPGASYVFSDMPIIQGSTGDLFVCQILSIIKIKVAQGSRREVFNLLIVMRNMSSQIVELSDSCCQYLFGFLYFLKRWEVMAREELVLEVFLGVVEWAQTLLERNFESNAKVGAYWVKEQRLLWGVFQIMGSQDELARILFSNQIAKPPINANKKLTN